MTSELFIRIIADGAVLPIVLIGTYALVFKIPKNKRLESYKQVLMAGLTAYLFAKMSSIIFQQSGQRPFELLGTAAGASYLNNPGFPSDHALFVTAITYAVWFQTKHRALTAILAVLTLAVCVGRVLALVHTPLDVIGDIVIASVGAIWYLNSKP